MPEHLPALLENLACSMIKDLALSLQFHCSRRQSNDLFSHYIFICIYPSAALNTPLVTSPISEGLF